MAQAEVENILRGLQLGFTAREARQRSQQEQERIESEKAYREAESKKFEADLAERKRQFDLQQKASNAMLEAQLENYRQTAVGNILEHGVPIPGETTQGVLPETQGVLGGIAPDISANPKYIQHTLPVHDAQGNPISVILPSQEEYTRQQSERARALEVDSTAESSTGRI